MSCDIGSTSRDGNRLERIHRLDTSTGVQAVPPGARLYRDWELVLLQMAFDCTLHRVYDVPPYLPSAYAQGAAP